MFTTALALVRSLEGGIVDRPDDPGHLTNAGITQQTWQDLGFSGSVASASRQQIAEAYRMLWDALKLHDAVNARAASAFEVTPQPADSVAFQFFVNVRPTEFIRAFQGAIGVRMDGVLGIQTWRGLELWNGDARARSLSMKIIAAQHWVYQSGNSPFKAGLLNRCTEVQKWLMRN